MMREFPFSTRPRLLLLLLLLHTYLGRGSDCQSRFIGPSTLCRAHMAHSLSDECTPLKTSYDSCFNSWFAGYLEPALSPQQQAYKEQHPEDYSKQKAAEYQEKCGKIWEDYRDCVQKAIKQKGLTDLLNQAREENPLEDPPPVSVDLPPQPKSPPS